MIVVIVVIVIVVVTVVIAVVIVVVVGPLPKILVQYYFEVLTKLSIVVFLTGPLNILLTGLFILVLGLIAEVLNSSINSCHKTK